MPGERASVSVVIPAYNAEPFIADTLVSVLAQAIPGMEVIVVDDGSRDGTTGVVAGFGEAVTLVAGPRRGVSAARNEGVRRSSAEFIAFMDHDDLWLPDKTRRQLERFAANPAVGLVFTQARLEGGEQSGEIYPVFDDPASFLARAHENLLHWNYIPMSSVMVRRAALPPPPTPGGDGPFDTRLRLSEDWDMWLRITERSALDFIPEALTRYRIVAGRATERMADLRLEDLLIFDDQLSRHPELAASDPERVRATKRHLLHETGYWLLKEGRSAEARPLLARAWRMRPASFRTLRLLATSLLGPLSARLLTRRKSRR